MVYTPTHMLAGMLVVSYNSTEVVMRSWERPQHLLVAVNAEGRRMQCGMVIRQAQARSGFFDRRRIHAWRQVYALYYMLCFQSRSTAKMQPSACNLLHPVFSIQVNGKNQIFSAWLSSFLHLNVVH